MSHRKTGWLSRCRVGYGMDDRGIDVRILAGVRAFFCSVASRLALVPSQPPIQLVRGVLSPGVKWPLHECIHSPSHTSQVRIERVIHPLPHMP
jgi:hypothetical protein